MPFDLQEHLARTSRAVEAGARDGAETQVVRVARTYPTDARDLWGALTEPDRLARWFLPVSGDLREGGRYQFEGNAGGTIEACVPPERLEVAWEYGGAVSWLAVRLIPEPDGVRTELAHEAHPTPGFSDRYGPGAAGVGWDLAFLGLARYVEDPQTFRAPPESDRWASSPEAMDFYRATSDAWGRAAVRAGTPEAEAFAAA